MIRSLAAAFFILTVTCTAYAQNCAGGQCSMIPSRGFVLQSTRYQAIYAPARTVAKATQTTSTKAAFPSSAAESRDALDEVNATRASRGLRPFLHDHNLTMGALNVSKFRAERLITGHTANDFAGLPTGASARAAGCAAWPVSLGWGACATYENFTYAGAAWAMGADNKRYMHLFVR